MRQSFLFTKILKETPKDEVSKNSQLLLRAGFIYKEMAGVYSFLPLGLRVINKIENVIREELQTLGAVEVSLSSFQSKETWEPTNQWSDEEVDVWFKTKLKNDTELGLAFTHEAAITRMLLSYVNSYRDLPKLIYQFQTKFRNEARAKSGIMRTREFVMKDMYSFARTQAEHEELYEKAKAAYVRIFSRLGLGDYTYLTVASGGVFAKFSHEFQTLTEAGEDTIYVDRTKQIAFNKEVYSPTLLSEFGVQEADVTEEKASEVGNIFNLGTRFSHALGLQYVDEQGSKHDVIMGSYGIGPARVMGTVVEILATDKGIIWPEEIAPFKIHLLVLGEKTDIIQVADDIYSQLENAALEVLYDDRSDYSNGEKLTEADIIGCPWRVVVSEKSLEKGGAEVKRRTAEESEIIPLDKLVEFLSTAHVQ